MRKLQNKIKSFGLTVNLWTWFGTLLVKNCEVLLRVLLQIGQNLYGGKYIERVRERKKSV